MESRKTVLMNLFSEHSDIENRLMDTEMGEEGESGTNGESHMETYALPYAKYIAKLKFAVMTQGTQTRICNNLEGWDGRWQVQEGRHMNNYG